ncbi:MAG: RHS repeat protein [Rhodopseudomonas palustris]|nr:RHS repeat protein [Rhodopseudomonas palustris]
MGRLARIEASDGNFNFGYDNEGRLIRRDNANGTVTEYAYDNGGRLARVAHASADAHPIAVREYAYDADGNLTLATDQAGMKTSYRYDLERRLIEEAYPTGASPTPTGPPATVCR